MTITTLSKSKLEYTINQMIIAFELCKEFEILNLTYSTSYSTPNSANSAKNQYIVDLSDYDNTMVRLASFEVRSNCGSIVYKITGKEDAKLISNFTTRLLKKIGDLENEQFKKVFTLYDTTEERDDRLKELLFQEYKSETIEKEYKPKKKWWNW